eukprot:Nk52_evm9s211 gene=Nk52_evmTU9s211
MQGEEEQGKGMVDLSFEGQCLKLDTAEQAAEVCGKISGVPEGKLRGVKLSGNTIGVEAAIAIADVLKDRAELEVADLSDIFTGRLLKEIPPALVAFSSALGDKAQLRVLDLSDNAFGPVGAESISELLITNSHIETLRLNNNGLGIGGGKIIAESLMKGVARAIQGEAHTTSAFTSSSITACTGTSTSSPPAMHAYRLQHFHAGRNRLEVEGAKALSEAFSCIGTMTEISLPQNGISYKGIRALAGAVALNPSLRMLDLNDNTFTKKGCVAMARVLSGAAQLEKINFGDCLLGSKGCGMLSEALEGDEHLQALRFLDLTYNEINDAAAVKLGRFLRGKKRLEKVELNGNCIGEEGLKAIQTALRALSGCDGDDVLGSLSENESECSEDEEEEEEETSSEEEEAGGEEQENVPLDMAHLKI